MAEVGNPWGLRPLMSHARKFSFFRIFVIGTLRLTRRGLGFRVWGLGSGVKSLGFGVWGLGCRVLCEHSYPPFHLIILSLLASQGSVRASPPTLSSSHLIITLLFLCRQIFGAWKDSRNRPLFDPCQNSLLWVFRILRNICVFFVLRANRLFSTGSRLERQSKPAAF